LLTNPALYIGIKGALLALLVFSFFSYPFAISSFVLQLVFLTALLAGASETILTITGRKTILLTLPFAMAILVVSIHYYPHRKEHYQAMSVWREAERWYNFRAYQAAVETYEEALGNFEAAEKAYRKSSLMIPSSLLPKYLSAKLFIESDQSN